MVTITPGEKDTPPVRPYFDPRVTVGNVITIVMGVIALTLGWSHFTARLDDIEDAVNRISCTLAYAGIAPTTGACVLPRGK